MIRKSKKRPIENHKTASWANINKKIDITIPSIEQVENAKKYVDENQK